MRFYNTNDLSDYASLKEAVMRSGKNISGLYMPEQIPELSESFIKNISGRSLTEIAVELTYRLLGDDIPLDAICSIVENALNFEIPLRRLGDDLYVLELFHGPTLAFKDVGARFMAGLMEYILKDDNREVTVLAATSGDTGSAVANAFFGKEKIKVIILYPYGKVSGFQEMQLITMGGNIQAIAVNGTFDDCQSLVRGAFSDGELNNKMVLTSANSINFARLFPQSFYYFYAFSQLDSRSSDPVFSVPSGNFGNLTAGLMAGRMGLPFKYFIASTNVNRSVPDYLENGLYEPKPTLHTISNAMDVGNPGNFRRILDLYASNTSRLRKDLKGCWFSDDQTLEAMKRLWDDYSYTADPHSAVGFLGLQEKANKKGFPRIFLATAHPVKFAELVLSATGIEPDMPHHISNLMNKEGNCIRMENSFIKFRDYLLSDNP